MSLKNKVNLHTEVGNKTQKCSPSTRFYCVWDMIKKIIIIMWNSLPLSVTSFSIHSHF